MPKPSLDKIYQKVCTENFSNTSPDSFITGKAEDLVPFYKNLETFIRNKAHAIATHQVRNIYQKIARAQKPKDVQGVLPKLTYVAARLNDRNANDVVALFYGPVESVKSEEHVKNFKTLAEAVVAYHKYYNPK